MRLLNVTNIQRGCVHDGPGVRTTVFLRGCTMHCPWCCNPETLDLSNNYYLDYSICVEKNGGKSKLCDGCEMKDGEKPMSQCPFGVVKPVSKKYSVDELYSILSVDFSLMKKSNGGLTFSGGEPLIQIETLQPLLYKLNKSKINIAFETTLTTSDKSIEHALEYANYFIVDVKLQPNHPLYKNDYYLWNLKNNILKIKGKGKKMFFRLVFVNSIIDHLDEIVSMIDFLGINELELLQCHGLAKGKYQKLNIEFVDYSSTKELFDYFSKVLLSKGVYVKKLTI